MEDVDDLPLEKLYENFSQSKSSENIVRSFQALKSRLNLNSLHGLDLYRALREKLSTHWKARDVFQLLEKRANQKEYLQQTAAKGVRVFIVGAGPIGLRQAIECILLGAEVIVVEKRSSFSRNNVLHLWPCTIEDLRQLGAKKFYGKFCAGAIDHISIRSLQCILLKVCLLLGVTFHSGVEFLEILEPDGTRGWHAKVQEILQPDGTRGWHAKVSPDDHKAADFDFNVLVGADGHRSTILGFDRKELRGKLALTITANFENCFTMEEAAVDEISGVAFMFNQKFFKDLKEETGIDLENIVYYKDDTHYFFMTAKKDSLLKKGVLKDDYHDIRELLKPSNIDMDELYEYVSEAAERSTDLQLNNFSMNHSGSPDVALFDFTSIYQAEYAARAINRKGKDLLLCVVGDALLEPFWPTGTGCSRGFLSAMDTAWLIRGLGQKRKMLDLLRERESIFQLLPQTIPEKLHTNIKEYTIDPQTRYQNLDVRRVKTQTIEKLYDIKTGCDEELHKGSVQLVHYSEPEGELKDPNVLQNWLQEQVKDHGIKVTNLSTSWSDGMALCALIYHFHPELIPNFDELSPSNAVENNQLAFSIAEEQFGITSLLKPTEMENPDKLGLFTYLSLFYEFFTVQGRKSGMKFLATSPPSAERSWTTSSPSDICYFCNKKVYLMERMSANGLFFHRSCFRCSHCNCQLKIGGYSLSRDVGGEKGKFFCTAHYRQLFLSNPEAINYSRAGVPKRDSQQEEMEVEEKTREAPLRRPIGGGNVKRLWQGFEQLEAAAKWEQSTLAGRDHVSSGAVPAKPPRSWSQLEPLEGTRQLAVIEEKKEEEGGRVSPSSPRRPRSPSQWRGPIVNRLPEEDVKYLPRRSAKLKRSPKIRHGQKGVARPLIGTYDTSDRAIQERRKQQQRFRDAQLIQREMGQLERQYEELEEVGRQIEQCLRDTEGTSQEEQFMKSWLGLVNEKNALTRKTSELSLRMKELELEDRQYEVDKELNELLAIPEEEQTAKQVARFNELCEMKLKIVEERNELVMQTEEDRTRELEEDEALSLRLDERFGSSYDSTPEVELEEYDVSKLSKELNQLCAIPEAERTAAQSAQFEKLCEKKRLSLEGELSHHTHRASKPEEPAEAILSKKKAERRSRMKSWWLGTL